MIGNTENNYGRYLLKKFLKTKQIKFLGTIYDLPKLNSLRKNSNIYFHGHSVGGTNPSLLEAMASHAFICAHDNIFNKSILGENAFYFSNAFDIKNFIETKNKNIYQDFVNKNYSKVIAEFNWIKINKQYEKLI